MEWLKKLNASDLKLERKNYIIYGVFLFLIGGVLGFIIEELYFLFDDGILIKRGFLYGPFIPIYGWGILLLTVLLEKYKKKPVLIFSLAMILAGILEGLTGYVMFNIWNKRWWDYTGLLFNIGGFVCLKSILQFGFGGLAAVYVINPLAKCIFKKYNKTKFTFILYFGVFIYLIDTVLSFLIKHKI